MLIQGRKKSEVTFVCEPSAETREVYLVGDFNDWQTHSQPMRKAKDGSFRAQLKLPRGRYEYKFLADGIWLDDGAEAEQAPNDFGTLNNVVVVE